VHYKVTLMQPYLIASLPPSFSVSSGLSWSVYQRESGRMASPLELCPCD
jgi:hypothetical protein